MRGASGARRHGSRARRQRVCKAHPSDLAFLPARLTAGEEVVERLTQVLSWLVGQAVLVGVDSSAIEHPSVRAENDAVGRVLCADRLGEVAAATVALAVTDASSTPWLDAT